MSTAKKSKFPLKWLIIAIVLIILAYYFFKPKETPHPT
ncbi:Uncharacterised protein [Moraxella bovis]|uniref:Uncharacterized protein n=1 Tax=Moraxella bovis TaxID=476 RepID=A0A378PTY0_MORBO|nr:Uncharacterised protein [Moraxella bovis]